MYQANGRQYILKQSTGAVWNIYHDEKLGLCYSVLTKRNVWTNPVSLFKNAYPVFFADVDAEDRFHIVFQDTQGNIQYSQLDSDSIKTVPVLNSKSPTAYNKHLWVIPLKNNIHFFYVLKHETSNILAYQILSDGKISNPKVIDYVADNPYPYSILSDKQGSVYLFHQSSDGRYLQLGYRKYNPGQRTWSEFNPVTKHQGNCEYPRAVMDSKGVIHLCYQRQVGKQYEMIYTQKAPEKNLWSDETKVHASVHPFEQSSILWANETVTIFWVREDVIYFNTGRQSGAVWGKPSRHNFQAGKQLTCLAYRTNSLQELEKVAISDIPGCFIGGLKLAFYQPPTEAAEGLTADELKNLILDSLKLLRNQVEELKESDDSLREELARFAPAQQEFQELEKDVVKCTMQLNALERQAAQVKQLGSRVEELTREVAALKARLAAVESGEAGNAET